MPVYRLGRQLAFPPPEEAVEGLLAVGGDLRPERLLLAYRMGIFPWYDETSPILWHSPDPRAVLQVECLHTGRTLRKRLRQDDFEIRFDSRFSEVIRACKDSYRAGQRGTWITQEMEEAYVYLHQMGFAHSVETWVGGELVGGLYGVSLGRVFFGESMFSRADDASKLATVALVERVKRWEFKIVDCQVLNPHTQSLGAENWPRSRFLRTLAEEVVYPTRRGSWADPELPAV